PWPMLPTILAAQLLRNCPDSGRTDLIVQEENVKIDNWDAESLLNALEMHVVSPGIQSRQRIVCAAGFMFFACAGPLVCTHSVPWWQFPGQSSPVC
ncbi:MAG: hypothetical protein ACKPHU_02415, partial [Planctomycetaceae bacterium]